MGRCRGWCSDDTCDRLPQSAQRLATLLEDEAEAVYIAVLRVFVHLDGEVVAKMPLLARLGRVLDHEMWDVRRDAVVVLGKLGEEELTKAVPKLVELSEDDDEDVRAAVMMAMRGLSQEAVVAVVPHIVARLEDNYDLARRCAVLALGKLEATPSYEHCTTTVPSLCCHCTLPALYPTSTVPSRAITVPSLAVCRVHKNSPKVAGDAR